MVAPRKLSAHRSGGEGMIASDLAINKQVRWRGLLARIIDIQWQQHGARVRLAVKGSRERWASIAEIERV